MTANSNSKKIAKPKVSGITAIIMCVVFLMIFGITSMNKKKQKEYKLTSDIKWSEIGLLNGLGMGHDAQKLVTIIALTFMVSMLLTLFIYGRCIVNGCPNSKFRIKIIVVLGLLIIGLNATVIDRFNRDDWKNSDDIMDKHWPNVALFFGGCVSTFGIMHLLNNI